MAPVKRSEKKKKKPLAKKKMTETTKKRKHFNYTVEALAGALQAIKDDKLSIREACRSYGVPRSTVQDRIYGRSIDQPRKVGPAPLLGFDGEEKVVNWIINLAKCGIPINKEQLIETVSKLIHDMGKKDLLPKGKLGQTWYKNFLRRHPEISLREPEGINKAREAVTERYIRNWFTDLKSFIFENGWSDVMNDPDRIFNADETGVSLCPKSGKVLAPKGYKNVYIVKKGNEKETLTVLLMISASGKIGPPLVVFPYIKPPKAVVDCMPEGWILGKTLTGWMRSETFYEYIANDFNEWVENNKIKKPIILFVDGHKSHMSMPLSQFCEENEIILYALPPNTTHVMQPADVSVFRPLKQEWKNTVRNWQSKSENINKTVTKTNFCQVFAETLDKDMTVSIKNGFRKCGLFPFDVEAIDFTKCVRDFQRRSKKSPIPAGELTERDYARAKNVINSLKDILLKRGIDGEIVCDEIDLARSLLIQKRRSTSKTPRKSTEVVTHTPFKSPKVLQNKGIGANEVAEENITDISLLENISIPDVGSYVSLSDISIVRDLNFDYLELNSVPLHDTSIESHIRSENKNPDEEDSNIIITSAEVCTEKTMQEKKKDSANKERAIEIIQLDMLNSSENEKTTNPFDKHLKFPISIDNMGKMTNKKKSIYTPSAISSKKWREYYENKEKEKQCKIENKNKRKIEKENRKTEAMTKTKKISKSVPKMKKEKLKILHKTEEALSSSDDEPNIFSKVNKRKRLVGNRNFKDVKVEKKEQGIRNANETVIQSRKDNKEERNFKEEKVSGYHAKKTSEGSGSKTDIEEENEKIELEIFSKVQKSREEIHEMISKEGETRVNLINEENNVEDDEELEIFSKVQKNREKIQQMISKEGETRVNLINEENNIEDDEELTIF